MKLTRKEQKLIQDYLNHYYDLHRKDTGILSLRNQLELLYEYTTHIVK